MRVTCFFFCKSSCASCIYNTTAVIIKNTDGKKKLAWLAVSKAEIS